MSDNPTIRALRLPPPNLGNIRVPRTRLLARTWYRVHATRYSAAYFSVNDAHRFSHPKSPHPLLYLGSDVDTCLFERFGSLLYDHDNALNSSLWQANSVSSIQIPDLHVCDLTNPKTLSAIMVDISSLMHNDLSTPQAWGLAIRQHPATFQAIKFESRFNGKACLALFQRDDIEKLLVELLDQILPNSDEAVDWLRKHKLRLY